MAMVSPSFCDVKPCSPVEEISEKSTVPFFREENMQQTEDSCDSILHQILRNIFLASYAFLWARNHNFENKFVLRFYGYSFLSRYL